MPYFLLLALFIAIFFLYRQGLMVSRSTRAILFAFWPGRYQDKAELDSCTGWVRHVGRFRESRTYEFTLDCQLSKGNVKVTLLDRKKQVLLLLHQGSPAGHIELDGKARYYLRWEFHSATGKCELRW